MAKKTKSNKGGVTKISPEQEIIARQAYKEFKKAAKAAQPKKKSK